RESRLTHAIEPLEALVPILGGTLPEDSFDISDDRWLALEQEASLPDHQLPSVPSAEQPRAEVLCRTYRNLAEVAYYSKPERRDYYTLCLARLSLRLKTTEAAAQGFGICAFCAAEDGRFALADLMSARALHAGRVCRHPVARMFTESIAAAVLVMEGLLHEALVLNAQAVELALQVAEPLRLMTVVSVYSLSLAAAGQLEESTRVAQTLFDLAARYGYVRLRELGYVCSCASALLALRFQEACHYAAFASTLESTGSSMLACQLRSYGTVAEAFLAEQPDPESALGLAELWQAQGFNSMLCNIEGNTFLVGALSAPHLTEEQVRRFDQQLQQGWDPAHRNHAKTGLFLASAGLFALALGRPHGQVWFDKGVIWLRERGFRGDMQLIEHTQTRLGLG
ncbi:MAG: hypothetical protein AAFS10_03500, partial [Myxococcota bacterium]